MMRRTWFRSRATVCGLAAVAATSMAGRAWAQTYTEVEPNDTRATANEIPPGFGVTLNPGETIGGFTSGTSTTTPGVGSADNFRVKIAPAAPGIYKNTLTATGAGVSQAYTCTIRGFTQSASGISTTSDAAVQTNSTTSPRFVQWYGFGKGEEVLFRITGTSGASGTNGDYTIAYTREAAPIISTTTTFSAGNITVSTIGQTTVNTDFWVYDSNFDPVLTFGNDDNSVTGGGPGTGTQSIATRDLPQGTYYIAISNNNLANDQASPSDERVFTGSVLETPNHICNSSTTANQNVSLVISDTAGNSEPVAATKVAAFDVVFVQFVVGPPQTILATPAASPDPMTQGSPTLLTVLVTPAPSPPNTITSVTMDLTPIGGSSTQTLFNDGTNGDGGPDNTWSFLFTPPTSAAPGSKILSYSVSDNGGRTVTGTLVVTLLPIAPANDDCSTATLLADGVNMPFAQVVYINQAQPDQQLSCQTSGATSQNGIWYRYTPTADVILEMRETGSRDVSFAVVGGACGGFDFYCEATETDANVILQANTTYYILVATPGAASATFTDFYAVSFTAQPLPAPPSNDDCSNPIDLTGETFPYIRTVAVGGARPDFDVTCNGASQTTAANAIWYSYTATQDVAIQITETDPNTFGQFSVYSSCVGFELGCRLLGGTTPNTIVVPAGQTYLIMISRNRQGTASADYDLVINIIPNPVPNWVCDGAIEFTASPFVDSRANVYSADGPGVSCVTGSAARSRSATWYKHTPAHTTSISFRENSAQDAFIVIFTGSCGALTEYWCNVFSPLADVTSRVRLEAGQTYYFMVAREPNSDPALTDLLTFQVNDISTTSAQPANDLCSGARLISQLPFSETVFHAAAQADFKTNCSLGTASNAALNGVWYRYQNGPNAATGVAWTNPPDEYPSKSQIAVYAANCPLGDFAEVTCHQDGSNPESVTFAMNPNTTYFILIANSVFYQAHADERITLNFNALTGSAPAPFNATCETATPISSVPFRDFVWSAAAPTDLIDVACNSGSVLNNAVWYSYTAAADGWAVFREDGPQDASIAVFTSCPTVSGTEIRCASFADVGVLQLSAGVTYHFIVARFATTFSNPADFWDFRFDLIPNAGANDLCENATVIDTFPAQVVIPTDLLTDDAIAVTTCTSASPQRRGVWFTFTARDTFVLMAEEVGPQTGSRIYALFTGTCGSLTQVPGCSTNSNTTPDFDFSSPLAMRIEAGQTYHLLVGSRAATVTNAEQRFYDIRLYTVGSDVGRCSTGRTCELTVRQNCTGTFIPGAAPCPGDFNCLGGISVQDIFDFLAAYFSNDPRADFNNSGGISVQDIFDFLTAYFNGC